jgi:hypothetical protein
MKQECVMDIFAILWPIVTGAIILVAGAMFIDRPKITTPSLKGWKELKQINTYSFRDFSTDTDSFIEKELKTRDCYTVYGITIRNERWILRGVKAEISRATIRIWDSTGHAVTDGYGVRLWGGRKNAFNDPLFPRNRVSPSSEIGEGEELDLVICYNQENEAAYYMFTIETHLKNNFMIYKDQFKEPMPHYAHVKIHGHRINKSIFLRIDETAPKELEISLISRGEFPFLYRTNTRKNQS